MRPWLIVLIILFVLFLVAAIAVAVLFWAVDTTESVESETVLELKLSGLVSESKSENPFELLFDPDRMTMYDYWRVLDRAGGDSRIKAIYLEILPLALSWAQLEEMRDALLAFREKGKPIHAFLAVDLLGESELYLASAADSITINPDTALMINGLVAEVTFFKQTMEKLQIEPNFIQFKEVKSPEVYDREDLSQPVREMFTSIISDLESRFVETVASDRELPAGKLREIINQGMITPSQAAETGLVDSLGYREQVFDSLKAAIGTEKLRLMKSSSYFRSQKDRLEPSSRHKVALLTGTGVITSGYDDPFAEVLAGSTLAARLREVRESDEYDAVLLRVDSPGGSAVGSDMVWKEIELLQGIGKPVVVSMSGVAGSGGYYISMGADRIISQPSTITGSIGVIFGKFDFEGLFNYLGMSIDRVKLSPNADLFSPFTSLTPEQKEVLTDWIEEIYNNFVSKAAEGRRMEFEELEDMAHGRIYTGKQALEVGLVDEVGGYPVAVRHLRELMELPEDAAIRLVPYPRPKGFFESLSELGTLTVRPPALQTWLEREWRELSTPAPRLQMPEAKIY